MPEFLFIYETSDQNSVVGRIQSSPILRGLRALGRSADAWILEKGPFIPKEAKYTLVHYSETRALAAALQTPSLASTTIFCFGSDIYKLQSYVELANYVSAFIVPSRHHESILRPAVTLPVMTVPEAIDPVALGPDGHSYKDHPGRGAMWFGYPVSYGKSFDLLVEQVFQADPDFKPRIAAISSSPIVSPLVSENLTYEASNFYEMTSRFSHAVLSHFAYDLRVNTLIKSPNKMITAVVRGLVPYASATPSYSELADRFGLGALLFHGAVEFSQLLSSMDYLGQAEAHRLKEVRLALLDELSDVAVARRFLDVTGL